VEIAQLLLEIVVVLLLWELRNKIMNTFDEDQQAASDLADTVKGLHTKLDALATAISALRAGQLTQEQLDKLHETLTAAKQDATEVGTQVDSLATPQV